MPQLSTPIPIQKQLHSAIRDDIREKRYSAVSRRKKENSREKLRIRKQPTEPFVLREGQKNFIVGLDDCVCVASTNPISLRISDVCKAEEVKGAKEWLNGVVDEGHLVCFFAQRPERQRRATENWLKQHGFKYHSLIMGKPIAAKYHYIDDRHVQATTFRGKFAPLVRKEHTIEVFG